MKNSNITVIQFTQEGLFDDPVILKKMKLNNGCYIVDINIISNLISRSDYPLKKKNYCIKQLLDFLTYLDTKIHMQNTLVFPISTKELIDHFARDTYKKYMGILEELDIIKAVPYENGAYYSFKKGGSFTKQYRVLKKYINKRDYALIVIEDLDAKKKIPFHINTKLKVPYKFKKTIKKLHINLPEAIKAEMQYCQENGIEEYNMKTRISRIFYTNQKRFLKQGKKVNRIYHSFSNVSKVARRYYNIPFKGIDVVNCQPLLLALYLRKNGLPLDDHYVEDGENGQIYERFIGLKGMCRDKVKVAIYKYLFFGWNNKTQVNKFFKHIYPLTWESLKTIHQKEGFSLASVLQNTEAEIFNSLEPKRSKYYFTHFDAIYFSDIKDSAELQGKIINHFANYNIGVNLDIRDINCLPPKPEAKKASKWTFRDNQIKLVKPNKAA